MRQLNKLNETWVSSDTALTGLQTLAGARPYHFEPFLPSNPQKALTEINRRKPGANYVLRNFPGDL